MEIPAFLSPSPPFEKLERFNGSQVFQAALVFANEFKIDMEAALGLPRARADRHTRGCAALRVGP